MKPRATNWMLVSLLGLLLITACTAVPEIPETPLPAAPTVVPTETAAPTATPDPTETPQPEPTATQAPTETPAPEFAPVIGLEPVAEGLTAPLAMMPAGDAGGRLFIVEQTGQIRVLSPEGELLETPFLDVSDRMVGLDPDYDERGLLGLAFHPDYADNGRFYVYYSAPLRPERPTDWNHTSNISEFTVSADDPTIADPASERIVLKVAQPQSNHNGGQITFGPDGFLYIPLGDGGGANDVGLGHNPTVGNGQYPLNLLGSILRIDVDGGDPYAIPPDNPFEGDQGREEIFAYGLRNPYRISFDAGGEQRLFVGDVGQNLWEEADIVVRGGNYGWRIREGTHCFDPDNPDISLESCAETGPLGEPLRAPILEYPSGGAGDIGSSIIGGAVYRGSALPAFVGRYIFGDWSTSFGQPDGSLFAAAPPGEDDDVWVFEELEITTGEGGRLGAYLLSFGHDADNELYVLTTRNGGPSGTTGEIHRIVPAEQ